MSVKIYSKKKHGNVKLSKSFRLYEFACNDGSDNVKVDTKNIKNLQKIRDHYDKAITVTSGYRTPNYNRKIGGANNSYHTKGMATDIVVKNVDARKVAMYAESIGCRGVIWYPKKKFTHIDTRLNVYHAICIDNNYYREPTISLKDGMSGPSVKWLQYMLNQIGYKLIVDGNFGPGTKLAVKDFQRECKLVVDGVFGSKSREMLKKELMA